MTITVYTVTECEFSKQEKAYLQEKGLAFEEKNLETNREFLTEMLNISSNFAGTPVTKITRDDGSIVVLKGFTKEEFEKALGSATVQPAVTSSMPPAVEPMQPKSDTQPTQQVAPTSQQPQSEPPAQTPPTEQSPQPMPTMSPPPPPVQPTPSAQQPMQQAQQSGTMQAAVPTTDSQQTNNNEATTDPLQAVLNDLEQQTSGQ